jgi:integrase
VSRSGGGFPKEVHHMKTPSYLVRNRFGTYYFRLSIPLKFHGIIADKAKEFRRSLGTSSRREALHCARVWWVRLQAILLDFEHMAKESNKDKQELQDWFQERLLKGEAKVIAEKQLRERKKKEKLNGYIKEFGGSPVANSTSGTQIVETDSPLFSEVVEQYIKEKVQKQKWSGTKTEMQNRATFKLFQRIVGDLPILQIKREHALQFGETLQRLPLNLNKLQEFQGKSIDEIIKSNPTNLMGIPTVNHNVERISSFFNWAKINQIIENNPAQRLAVTPQKGQVTNRQPFTRQELGLIFFSDEFLGRSKHKRTDARFWVPLICAFSGMRLNEACQLYLSDIRQDDTGVWYISINEDADDKSLKTEASERDVPIHSKLIELGFLNYVDRVRILGHPRLFPELQYRKADGYGRSVSSWFTKFRGRIGIKDKSKVFHSFRHTVSNFFKQHDVSEVVAAAVIGHDHDTMTYGNYGKKYSPSKLVKTVELIDYGIDFSPLCDTAVNPWFTPK